MTEKRIVEVRMIVIALVDLNDPELTEALAKAPNPSAIAGVVSSEVISNLESVAFIDSVIVSAL